MEFLKLFFLLSLLLILNLNAQWSTDLSSNLQITDWSRSPLTAAGDGKGGLYIALNKDGEPYPEFHSYIFKVDKYGYSEWNNPIHIGNEEWQDKVELIEDGYGGVIAGIRDLNLVEFDGFYMVWDYKIKVQRIDSLGNKLWGDGVLVCTDTTDQYLFDICSDGTGGCYVSWLSEKTMDYINSDGYRAIQHISANGERMWSDTGKVLYQGSVANFTDNEIQIISDNNYGVITLNFNDFYSYSYLRVSELGEYIYETPGRTYAYTTIMKANENGGFIRGSKEWYGYNLVNVKLDKIDKDGKYCYESAILLADSVGEKSEIIDLFYSEDSSTSIYWRDQNLNGSANGSYYQKVSKDGSLEINKKGISPFSVPTIGSRMVESNDDYLCISGNYVQKMTENGDKLWGENGIQFTRRFANYDDFVPDTRGGFIKVWIEGLNGLWAQQVSSNGNLGEVITSIENIDKLLEKNYSLSQNYPNPFNPSTTIKYSIPVDIALNATTTNVTLKIFDILGREVATLVNKEQSPGNYSIKFDATYLTSGMYFYKLKSSSFEETKKMILLR